MEKNVLKLGLENDVFSPEDVSNLLYGRLKYIQKTAVATRENVTCINWSAYPQGIYSWDVIPVEERKEIVALIIEKCKKYTFYSNNLHIRILCLLHHVLRDKENGVECFFNFPGKPQSTITEYKYTAFLSNEQERLAPFEMFLWFYVGLRKNQEERRLLRLVWKKLLACDDVKSQKQRISLAEKKIEELEAEYQKVERQVKYNDGLIKKRYKDERKAIKKKHFSKAKRELLLQQVQEKDNAAHHRFWRAQGQGARCRLAINFLSGYLDFIKWSKQ